MHIKKGDKVIMISGSDKGKNGEVLKSFPSENKVIISGVNMRKKHVRSQKKGNPGQVIEKEMPVHASNVKMA